MRFSGEVRISGDGLVLREWSADDVPRMVELFDEESIDVWTPLASPFESAAATLYVARARRMREDGIGVQLAITSDGVDPLGEVLLFRGDEPGEAELAYAVGIAHRGQRLASRAVRLATDYACAEQGIHAFTLKISPANAASESVARACGFTRTEAPLEVRERKGRRLELAVWRSAGLAAE